MVEGTERIEPQKHRLKAVWDAYLLTEGIAEEPDSPLFRHLDHGVSARPNAGAGYRNAPKSLARSEAAGRGSCSEGGACSSCASDLGVEKLYRLRFPAFAYFSLND
jgi:hypothetical protein